MAEEKRRGPEAVLEGVGEGRQYNAGYFTKRYLDSLLIEMRIIDSDLASTKTDFFGSELETPILFGAMGGYDRDWNLLKEEAEAAVDSGSVIWLSNHVSAEHMKLCLDAGAKTVKIVKPFRDQEKWISTLTEAERLGCIAVGSDVDHCYSKNGGYDAQEGEAFEPKSVEELKEAVSALHVPFIAKGILSVQDAVKCQEAGVAGIVVSHHNSIMDCAVPPLMLLPQIRAAVGDDYPVFADCEIQSGADVFKALALGADGVCVSRALMKHLFAGRAAMADAVKKMTGELRSFMNRTSSPDVKHIDPSVIHRMTF